MIVMVLVNCYALFYAVMGGALILRAFGLWRESYRRR
jgi:hypothetical protein